MVEELNKTLPHDRHRPKRGSGSHHVHSAPLTEESKEPAPIPAPSAPPSVKVVAPVINNPTKAPSYDRPSNYGSRGGYPKGYDYGERYGGRQSTRFNLSLVDDEEADARVEWLYQSQRQALWMPAYGDPYQHPFPSTGGGGLRVSFDDQQRESQAIPALDRIEKVMERMERQLAASTSASMASSTQHHALPGLGKFRSFHYSLNC
jgi:hypothetical protein